MVVKLAENITTSSPIKGEDNNQFNKIIEEATKKVERLDRATAKADKTLKKYAETFDSLNDSLKEFIKSSRDLDDGRKVKSAKAPTIKGGDNNIKSFDRLFKAVIGPSAGTQAFKKYYQKFSDTRSGLNSLFGSKNRGNKSSNGATGKEASGIALLGKASGVATTSIAALVASLWLMEEAGKAAHDRNLTVSRSLETLGEASNNYSKTGIETANQMVDISNTWSRIGNDLTSAFGPFFDLCVDFVDWVSGAIEGITGILGGSSSNSFTTGNSRVRWYSSKLEASGGDTESKSLPVLSDIASSAKQSGFTNESAANLAIGTYDAAVKLAKQYGVEASKVAEQLSDAWLNGSDAAKEYGVVVDDQVLAGYMASKGVDIVNTEISDAMKQYYRYQLMLEQASASNSDYMQDQINDWKELGMMIDKTKGKLFAFDEVIQLSAMDTTIPDVGTPDVSFPGGESGSGGVAEDPTFGDAVNNLSQSMLPILLSLLALAAPGLLKELLKIPFDKTESALDILNKVLDIIPEQGFDMLVNPKLNEESLLDIANKLNTVDGVRTIDIGVNADTTQLDDLLYKINSIPSTRSLNLSVFADTAPLVYFLNELNSIPNTKVVKTSVYTDITPLIYLIKLLNMLPPEVNIGINTYVPGFNLLYTTLDILREIQGNWYANVDISVSGLNIIEKAYNTLRSLYSWVSSLFGKISRYTSGGSTSGVGAGRYTSEIESGGASRGGGAGRYFADGGIGTREIHNATLFEDNKKEAVIPLETSAGIQYLSDALREAGLNPMSGSGDTYEIHLTLSGLNIADNNAQWEKVGRKIAEVIDVQRQRRGELNYGSSF